MSPVVHALRISLAGASALVDNLIILRFGRDRKLSIHAFNGGGLNGRSDSGLEHLAMRVLSMYITRPSLNLPCILFPVPSLTFVQ